MSISSSIQGDIADTGIKYDLQGLDLRARIQHILDVSLLGFELKDSGQVNVVCPDLDTLIRLLYKVALVKSPLSDLEAWWSSWQRCWMAGLYASLTEACMC